MRHNYGFQLLEPSLHQAASFAVDDHNRKMKTKLELIEIVKAATVVDTGLITYLTIKVRDEMGIEKIFTTSVCEMPTSNIYDSSLFGSTGLQYVCKATELPPLLPQPSSSMRSSYLDNNDIKCLAEFAVKTHNNKENTRQLKLVDVVDVHGTERTEDYFNCCLILLLVNDQKKFMVFKTRGTKLENLMQTAELKYLYEVPQSFLCPTGQTPNLISAFLKKLLDFIVEENNSKKGTQIELVDCLAWNEVCVKDGHEFNVTLQVINQGNHEIYKTMVKERHRKSHFECGVLESTNLEFVSNARPRPKAESNWVSVDLESKTDQLQSLLRAEQEMHISVAFR